MTKNSYMGINYEEGGRGILVERGQIVSIGEDGKKTREDAEHAIFLKRLYALLDAYGIAY